MAHKRKDTLTAPPEWWKHLRPFNKRRVSKKERVAAALQVSQEKGADRTGRLGRAAGMWKNRRNLPDFAAIRRSWDRG